MAEAHDANRHHLQVQEHDRNRGPDDLVVKHQLHLQSLQRQYLHDRTGDQNVPDQAGQAGEADGNSRQRLGQADHHLFGNRRRNAHQVAVQAEGRNRRLRRRLDQHLQHLDEPELHAERPDRRHRLPIQGPGGERHRRGCGVGDLHRGAAGRRDADRVVDHRHRGDADHRQLRGELALQVHRAHRRHVLVVGGDPDLRHGVGPGLEHRLYLQGVQRQYLRDGASHGGGIPDPAAEAGQAHRDGRRGQRQIDHHLFGNRQQCAEQMAVQAERRNRQLRYGLDGRLVHLDLIELRRPRPYGRYRLPVQGAGGERFRQRRGLGRLHRGAAEGRDPGGQLGGSGHCDPDHQQLERQLVAETHDAGGHHLQVQKHDRDRGPDKPVIQQQLHLQGVQRQQLCDRTGKRDVPDQARQAHPAHGDSRERQRFRNPDEVAVQAEERQRHLRQLARRIVRLHLAQPRRKRPHRRRQVSVQGQGLERHGSGRRIRRLENRRNRRPPEGRPQGRNPYGVRHYRYRRHPDPGLLHRRLALQEDHAFQQRLFGRRNRRLRQRNRPYGQYRPRLQGVLGRRVQHRARRLQDLPDLAAQTVQTGGDRRRRLGQADPHVVRHRQRRPHQVGIPVQESRRQRLGQLDGGNNRQHVAQLHRKRLHRRHHLRLPGAGDQRFRHRGNLRRLRNRRRQGNAQGHHPRREQGRSRKRHPDPGKLDRRLVAEKDNAGKHRLHLQGKDVYRRPERPGYQHQPHLWRLQRKRLQHPPGRGNLPHQARQARQACRHPRRRLGQADPRIFRHRKRRPRQVAVQAEKGNGRLGRRLDGRRVHVRVPAPRNKRPDRRHGLPLQDESGQRHRRIRRIRRVRRVPAGRENLERFGRRSDDRHPDARQPRRRLVAQKDDPGKQRLHVQGHRLHRKPAGPAFQHAPRLRRL